MSIVLLVVLATAVGGIWALRVRARRQAWAKAGSELGFDLEPEVLGGPPKMTGLIDGRLVTIEIGSDRVRKAKSTFTHYEVVIAAALPEARLTRRQKSALMQGLVGGVDAPIGDQRFDEVVIVDTSSPSQLAAQLTAEARVALIELFEQHPISLVTENRVRLATGRQERSGDALVSNARQVAALANLLTEDSQA